MKSRLFFITYHAANLGVILYGALALMMPSVLLDAFSSRIYQFPSNAISATAYLVALFRLVGFFNIILGVFGLVLLHRLLRSWQPWILRAVVVLTTLAYLGPIVFDNTVGSIGFFEIVEHGLFVLVIVLGVILWRDQDTG